MFVRPGSSGLRRFTFTLGVNQPVVVTGIPTLLLSDGGIAFYDPALSSPGEVPALLSFHYVIGAGDVTSDLVVAGLSRVGRSITAPGSLYFNAATTYGTGSEPEGMAAAEVNGDQKIDLAVANYDSGTVSVLLNASNSGGVAALGYPLGSSCQLPDQADAHGRQRRWRPHAGRDSGQDALPGMWCAAG